MCVALVKTHPKGARTVAALAAWWLVRETHLAGPFKNRPVAKNEFLDM